jgi:hypothetical protein
MVQEFSGTAGAVADKVVSPAYRNFGSSHAAFRDSGR